jgi:aminoglycoside phosphotransferase (APT) family kinase protein
VLAAAEARADAGGDDLIHFDVWSANICFTDRGAVLVDWGDAVQGNRWIDAAFALRSVRAEGATPPPIDFPDEDAYMALIAGHDAWEATQPPPEWVVDFERLRAWWIRDLAVALPRAAALLGLPPVR